MERRIKFRLAPGKGTTSKGADPAPEGILQGLGVQAAESARQGGLGGRLAADEAQGVRQGRAVVAAELGDGVEAAPAQQQDLSMVRFRRPPPEKNLPSEDDAQGVLQRLPRLERDLFLYLDGVELLRFLQEGRNCPEGRPHKESEFIALLWRGKVHSSVVTVVYAEGDLGIAMDIMARLG